MSLHCLRSHSHQGTFAMCLDAILAQINEAIEASSTGAPTSRGCWVFEIFDCFVEEFEGRSRVPISNFILTNPEGNEVRLSEDGKVIAAGPFFVCKLGEFVEYWDSSTNPNAKFRAALLSPGSLSHGSSRRRYFCTRTKFAQTTSAGSYACI